MAQPTDTRGKPGRQAHPRRSAGGAMAQPTDTRGKPPRRSTSRWTGWASAPRRARTCPAGGLLVHGGACRPDARDGTAVRRRATLLT
jgi:hypothetical protein